MKTYTFEVKDTVGCHFHCKKGDAPAVGSGAIIRIGKAEVPVTLRMVQKLKDESMVGLWYFVVKGMGTASHLIAAREAGQKATISYPVELTKDQLQKPKKAKAPKAEQAPAPKAPATATKEQKKALKAKAKAKATKTGKYEAVGAK